MTTDNTPNNTNPPDWQAAERRRPIEELLGASTAEACFSHVLAVLRQVDPAEVPSVEVLVDALTESTITEDDHSSVFQRGINAVLQEVELRPAVWLALAIRGLPGAAGEVAQAYAAVAVELSRWLRTLLGTRCHPRRRPSSAAWSCACVSPGTSPRAGQRWRPV